MYRAHITTSRHIGACSITVARSNVKYNHIINNNDNERRHRRRIASAAYGSGSVWRARHQRNAINAYRGGIGSWRNINDVTMTASITIISVAHMTRAILSALYGVAS